MGVLNNTTNITVDVNYELAVTFTALSLAILGLVGVALCVLYFIPAPTHIYITRWEVGVLSFAVFVSILQMVSYKTEDIVNVNVEIINKCSRIFYETFGTVVFFVGSIKLFRPRQNDDVVLLFNQRHKNVASFVLGMTMFLAVYLAILILGASLRHKPLIIAGLVTSFVQKFTQACLYCFSLQHKVPKDGQFVGASWFFKLLSVFNFLMFLNDLINLSKENDENFKAVTEEACNLLSVTYDSFDVDYRLLMAFIFFEHSLLIDTHYSENNGGGNANQNDGEDNDEDIHPVQQQPAGAQHQELNLSEAKGIGFLFGFVLFVVQFGNILQYKSLSYGWSNVFGILADMGVTIGGCALIYFVRKKVPHNYRLPPSNSMELLTIMMGVFSILYWILRLVIVSTWAVNTNNDMEKHNYLVWNATKYATRTISSVFQIMVYASVSHEISHYVNVRTSKAVNALVIFQMFAFVSVYTSTVIATYSGLIETEIQASGLNVSFVILYQAGGPIHLGFAFHVFLHFFVIVSHFVFTHHEVIETNRQNDQNSDTENEERQRLLNNEGN